MKTKLFIILMIFVFGCKPSGIEKAVSIINYKDSTGGEPQLINTGIHKDKDVEIFKITGSEIYSTIMYRVEKGELKAYESDQRSKNNYDRATYRWVNDSTISFRYSCSSNDSSVSYSMTGNNGWTSLGRIK
jgi:hypothetical protein